MGKILVLAEKPSVGREIARVLGCKHGGDGSLEGGKYIVTWALGHLVTLADPEAYDKNWKKWDMDYLPMLPKKMKLVVIKETGKQFNIVKRLMERGDVSELVIATDAGREGELVARWIMEKAGWKKPVKRLWISSQTDNAIREGFANLKPAKEYDNLYKSAAARSVADWLVGLNVTRALTCKYNASLSAGRVQTPTLAMIVEREKQIKEFKPKDFWTVSAKTANFSALWKGKDGQTRFNNREEAEHLAVKIEGKEGIITQVDKAHRRKLPPAAYDLTELQRDANKKFAYSAKETLSIMQSLYERHKVLTYPRTDSRYITDDMIDTLQERLISINVGEYSGIVRELLRRKPLNTEFIVNNAKVTDHHAIIPTEERPDFVRMTVPERNIYDLVVRRFMAVLMSPFEYEEVKLKLTVDGETFTAKGKQILSQGWQSAYDTLIQDDEEEDEKEQSLPDVKKGDKIKILESIIKMGKTRPPARYTEATLLSAMEHPSGRVESDELSKVLEQTSGLGTPATRADIIEKLFSSFYCERNGKEIMPTAKGKQLVGLVPEDLRSAELTARWEQQLSLISCGQADDRKFIERMQSYATELVNAVKTSDAKYIHENVTREKCPDCGKFLLAVKGKRGNMLICPDRECGYKKTVTIETNARCPNCHKRLELRGEGENRIFACVCGYREKLADFEKRRAERGASKSDVRRYMQEQNRQNEPKNSALAEQLQKWKAAKDK